MTEITRDPLFLLSVLFYGPTHKEALVPPTRPALNQLPVQAKFQADAGGPPSLAIATTGGYFGARIDNAWFNVFYGKTYYSIPTHPVSLSFVRSR